MANLFPTGSAVWRGSEALTDIPGTNPGKSTVPNTASRSWLAAGIVGSGSTAYNGAAILLLAGGAYRITAKLTNTGSTAATFKILNGGGPWGGAVTVPEEHNGTAIHTVTVPPATSGMTVDHAFTIPATATDATYSLFLFAPATAGTVAIYDVNVEQTNALPLPAPPAGSILTGDAFTFGGDAGTNPWTAMKSPAATAFALVGTPTRDRTLRTGGYRQGWRGGIISPVSARGTLKDGDTITAAWKLRNMTVNSDGEARVKAEIMLGSTLIASGPSVLFNPAVSSKAGLDPAFTEGTLTATVPAGHNWATDAAGTEGPRLRFLFTANPYTSITMELAEPSLIVPAVVPDPDPDPGADPASWSTPEKLAVDVARFLGRDGDADLIRTAAVHAETVFWYVYGYTRGRGFGSPAAMPTWIPPELRAVIVAAAARLAANPEQVTYYAANDYSERPAILAGWTLLERAVLHTYRRRSA